MALGTVPYRNRQFYLGDVMGSGMKVQAIPIRLRADDTRNLGFEANHSAGT